MVDANPGGRPSLIVKTPVGSEPDHGLFGVDET